jgi:micrococcal nuclease
LPRMLSWSFGRNSDGDKIKALTAKNQLLRARIAWIDAPEMGQAFGRRAKQFMSALVFGKDVELRPHSIHRCGRTVAIALQRRSP